MTRFNRVKISLAIAGAFLVGAAAFAPLKAFADEADDITSIVNGGRLYDNWLKVTGAPDPGKNHKSWKPAAGNVEAGDTTWRCKSCHGWDYKGKNGEQKGTPDETAAGGIEKSAGADQAKIIGILKNDVHDLGAILKEGELKDLANFVSKGQVDIGGLLKKGGDAAKGKNYFETLCVGCHLLDGTKPKDMAMKLGKRASIAPHRVLHKIINGNPGAKMPSVKALGDQVAIDIYSYIKTLPQ